MEKPSARFVKPGEMLAFHVPALHSGPQGFFWLFGGGTKANSRRDDVAIVHIRDGLEHHAGGWSDSYEAILERYQDALSGQDAVRAHERAHRWDDDYEPIEATPPSAVVFCIDSPGGAVSGLFEAVKSIKAIRKKSGVPLVAYVNEMAASAAYALACACDQIVTPSSAILGSVGVISTMGSQAEADKKAGVDIRLITSGARKGDGHPHAPITDAAVAAEQERVDVLAGTFWRLVSKSRGLPMAKVRGLQAGIFLGADAETRGLADEVASLDDVVAALSKAPPKKQTVDSGTGSGSLRHVAARTGAKGHTMVIKLSALIKRTEAAIESEKDAKVKKALQADLAAYKKTEKHVEHTKTEEGDDDEDEEDDEDDEDEEDEDAKAASEKKADEDAKAAAASDAEDEKDEKKKAKSNAAIVSQLEAALGVKGKQIPGALAAALAKVQQFDALSADVGKLKATQAKATKNALIDEARAQRRITPGQAEKLRGEKLAFVTGFLQMHTQALVNVDEDALEVPSGTPAADIPANVKAIVDGAIATLQLTGEKAEAFRAKAYEDQRKAASAQLGGVH